MYPLVSAAFLAAAHGIDDSFPTIITIHEIKHGAMTAAQLEDVREAGGLKIKILLTIDAESVYKSLTSRELKTPAEKTLLGHISWI